MKLELIPTVQSLLKQDAIRVEGDIGLIKAMTELISAYSFRYENTPMFDYRNLHVLTAIPEKCLC